MQGDLETALEGGTVCILVYGATGSGKTYTVTSLLEFMAHGIESEAQALSAAQGGSKMEVAVQIIEVYNEQFRDLLNPDGHADHSRRRLYPLGTGHSMVQGATLLTLSAETPGGMEARLKEALQSAQAHRAAGAAGRSASSHPPGHLWIGLRRSRVRDGQGYAAGKAEGEDEEADVVDLNEGPIFDDSSQSLHEGFSSVDETSLPTTTRTGNVFAEFHALKNKEDCKGLLQQKLQDIIEIGASEGWLFGTKDLELEPEKVLGVGGYGVVVAAKLHGADVAVKLPKFATTSGTIRHMISMANELRILRKVRHPSVVMFHGACIDTDLCELCLVSELVQGTQMDKFICPPPMPPGEAVRHKLIYDVCGAIRYLHAQEPPIIHGDLKPANVMVERRQSGVRAKILDFGLSRVQTKNAMPLGGTPQWKAPEVIRHDDGMPAPSADVFSFGLLAYFAVTGLKPFPGHSPAAVKHARKQGQNMPRVWPDSVALIEECRALCAQCLLPCSEERVAMPQVHVSLSRWRPLPGRANAEDACAKMTWHEQVQRMRELLSQQAPSPPRGSASSASMVASPKRRLLHPAFLPTPVASKRLTLTSILAQWNVPCQEDSCCCFHARLHEALLVLQELQMEHCAGTIGLGEDDSPHSQCVQCGLLDTFEGNDECAMCTWMVAADQAPSGEGEGGAPEAAKVSL
uniref:Protein kinase domain-containing protein n=1 Tax=Alexandrium catenella TaxID=2925 RepID=A0A7S1M0L5_ALECA